MIKKIEPFAITAFIVICSMWILLMMGWLTLVMFGVMDFPSVYVCGG